MGLDNKQHQLYDEGIRQMRLCNACRYCEGYCAVWQAIEWRRDFDKNDMKYLANLCHDCRDCYYACPFIPPHEFDINPPKIFASLREETYQKYAWPRGFAKIFGEKVSGYWIAFIGALMIFFGFIIANSGVAPIFEKYTGEGSFYALIPEPLMVGVFSVLGLWMVGIWILGAAKYWRDIRSAKTYNATLKDVLTAIKYSFSLRYLGGEGEGCTYPGEEPTTSRRWLHHLVGYGFLLTFASTSLAAFCAHILNSPAPYPVYHPVVILGTLGGLGQIIGTSGLLYLKAKSDKDLADPQHDKAGASFIMAIWTVNVTGMFVLLFRETAAMYFLLIVHLASVAALFFTAPYTKFVHFVYRFLSLVNYAQEERLVKEEEARLFKTGS